VPGQFCFAHAVCQNGGSRSSGCWVAALAAAFLAADLAGAFLAAAFLAAVLLAFLAAAFVAVLAAVLPAVLVAVLAAVLDAVLRADFSGRGSNSKLILPFACLTRKALNLRLVRLETKPSSRSVLPSANSLVTCSGEISCCRIILPVRKSQDFSGPTDFSQT